MNNLQGKQSTSPLKEQNVSTEQASQTAQLYAIVCINLHSDSYKAVRLQRSKNHYQL